MSTKKFCPLIAKLFCDGQKGLVLICAMFLNLFAMKRGGRQSAHQLTLENKSITEGWNGLLQF